MLEFYMEEILVNQLEVHRTCTGRGTGSRCFCDSLERLHQNMLERCKETEGYITSDSGLHIISLFGVFMVASGTPEPPMI